MSFEPREYPFPSNQEEIYYNDLYPISFQSSPKNEYSSFPNSLNEDALVFSQDFLASESLTNELEVCKKNVNILEKYINNTANDQYKFYIWPFTLSFIFNLFLYYFYHNFKDYAYLFIYF
ncbi:hypothetical protein C2G38_2155457 [Gigaspora rosea]|uniref:Uncharacterized protein n=1 Tax=Gigaspora rosea TaxID=44941 RepID=A0A397W566_9GLOM|nr:hypothetical protein C2G38_2155457 [Gigaspora rosea]